TRDLVRSQLPPEIQDEVIKVVTETGVWRGVNTHLTKSGQSVIVEMTGSAMRDTSGETIGYIGISRDITEQKRSEQALRAGEERYRLLLDNVQVGVILQGPNSEILSANPAALALFDVTEDQLLGKSSLDPSWDVIHEDGSKFPSYMQPVPQAV